jgi:hypothetical protein
MLTLQKTSGGRGVIAAREGMTATNVMLYVAEKESHLNKFKFSTTDILGARGSVVG